jgi:uncharacterized coiled-coil protein SlyX
MTNEKKPYVRYHLEADVADKGVGYSAKKAILVFLKTHNFEGQVTDFKPTSDHLTATLELYDNGVYDFNIEALQNHLRVSGQLPTQRDQRPKISIKPIPCNAPIQEAENPNYDAFQKTIDGFHQQAKEKEDTIKGLTVALTERQGAIEEATRKIDILEARLQRADPKQFATPREALLGSYLKHGLTTLLELNCDMQELEQRGELNRYLSVEGEKISFPIYLNTFYNLSIKNDAQLTDWLARVGKHEKWEETESGIAFASKYKQFEIDRLIFKTAEEQKASPEMLELLKKKVEQTTAVEKELLAKEKIQKNAFDTERKVYSQLEAIKANYEVFKEIAENSNKRRTKNANFSILEEIGLADSRITFVVPTIDSEGAYERRVYKFVEDLVSNTKKRSLLEIQNDDNFSIINITPTGITQEELLFMARKLRTAIINDSILKSLGITANIISLRQD